MCLMPKQKTRQLAKSMSGKKEKTPLLSNEINRAQNTCTGRGKQAASSRLTQHDENDQARQLTEYYASGLGNFRIIRCSDCSAKLVAQITLLNQSEQSAVTKLTFGTAFGKIRKISPVFGSFSVYFLNIRKYARILRNAFRLSRISRRRAVVGSASCQKLPRAFIYTKSIKFHPKGAYFCHPQAKLPIDMNNCTKAKISSLFGPR